MTVQMTEEQIKEVVSDGLQDYVGQPVSKEKMQEIKEKFVNIFEVDGDSSFIDTCDSLYNTYSWWQKIIWKCLNFFPIKELGWYKYDAKSIIIVDYYFTPVAVPIKSIMLKSLKRRTHND